jgi:hypothetical protein
MRAEFPQVLRPEVPADPARYRVDFALCTDAGNQTPHEIMRRIVGADPAVLPRWYPIRTWLARAWLRFSHQRRTFVSDTCWTASALLLSRLRTRMSSMR